MKPLFLFTFPVKIEPPCKGILSWKHYTKQASSEFSSWRVNFNKVKDNTSLYIMYTGTMGVYTHLIDTWACLRISVLFNGTQCSKPAPIASGSGIWKRPGGGIGSISSSAISGECTGLPSGLLEVTVKAESACTTASSGVHQGYRGSMKQPTTYSLRVEECCPPSSL